MSGTSGKYGLILPDKKGKGKNPLQLGSRQLNPLLNSDDELAEEDEGNEENALNWVEASLKKSAGNAGQKSRQKRMLQEAFKEDATVFQYDEIYDNMKASQEEQEEAKKKSQEKKPKYINTILKHAKKRKLENERRLERKVQKEREAEGDEFAEKESFVTSSYLKKLEELKKGEEEEQREKLLEERSDVHKHKNFGVFYNHLLKQKLGEVQIKEEPLDSDHESESVTFKTTHNDQRQKQYRTHQDHDESPDKAAANPKQTYIQRSRSSSSENDNKDFMQREGASFKIINKQSSSARDKGSERDAVYKKSHEHKTTRDNVRGRKRSTDSSVERDHFERACREADRIKAFGKGKENSGERRRWKEEDRERSSRKDRENYRSRERSKDRIRERSRDKVRERSRDKGRDRSKDVVRERSRDKGRERSLDRNEEKFQDKVRGRSRNKGKDKSRDDVRVRSKDKSRRRSRDGVRERSRDRSRERSSDESRERSSDKVRERSKNGGRGGCRSGDNDKYRRRSTDRNSERSRDKNIKREKSVDGYEENGRRRNEEGKESPEDEGRPRKQSKNKKATEEKRQRSADSQREMSSEDQGKEKSNVSGPRPVVRKSKVISIEDRIERFSRIFAKKTVGKTFKDAIQRYFQRKAEREGMGF